MSAGIKIVRRLRALFGRKKREAAMAEEMRAHLEMQIERHVAEGAPAEEARYAAQRQFGSVDRWKEQCRDHRGWAWLEQLARDCRFAFRSFAKSPGFTGVVVLTLALGIGANTAIFGFFRGILLRPLPFDQPERIVLVRQSMLKFGDVGFTPPDLLDVQNQSTSLEQVAGYFSDVATWTGRGTPDMIYGSVVSRNFFPTLGASARIGRTFSGNPALDGAGRLIVLSHGCWQTRFGADPRVIGQAITLNQTVFTIVGVMPVDFQFPRWVEFWATPAGPVPETTIGAAPVDLTRRDNNYLSVVGRLKAGVTASQATAELTSLVRRLPSPTPMERGISLTPIRDETIGSVRAALSVLLACVGLVLLVACLNVANLLLSRATARQREIGIRRALGASRGQIARQLLTESLLLALLGGVLGALLSQWGTGLLVRLAPVDIPRLSEVRIDGGVLGFALAVTLLTGIGFGLAPVWQAAKPELSGAMKQGDRSSSSPAHRRLRGGLVAAEVALSLVVLVAAGLLLKSFRRMQAVELGYDPKHVISMRISLVGSRYRDEASQRSFYRDLLRRLENTPGFESVGVSLDLIGQTYMHGVFVPEGQHFERPEEAPHASFHPVNPEFFRTLGIHLLEGRTFTASDDEKSEPVVMVNAALAQRFFPRGQAVGKYVQRGLDPNNPKARVVGVVADVKHDGPEREDGFQVYAPYPQWTVDSFFIQIRTGLDVASTGASVKRVIQEIDAGLPVSGVSSMQETSDFPAKKRRFPLVLIGLFAGLAVLLAAVGTYAVMAYAVAQRTREIGIRMALGAQSRAVVRLILRQGLGPIAIGLVAGIAGGVMVAFAMRSLLFGVEPLDASTFATLPLLLGAIGLAACGIPARAATRVDPMVALRCE